MKNQRIVKHPLLKCFTNPMHGGDLDVLWFPTGLGQMVAGGFQPFAIVLELFVFVHWQSGKALMCTVTVLYMIVTDRYRWYSGKAINDLASGLISFDSDWVLLYCIFVGSTMHIHSYARALISHKKDHEGSLFLNQYLQDVERCSRLFLSRSHCPARSF